MYGHMILSVRTLGETDCVAHQTYEPDIGAYTTQTSHRTRGTRGSFGVT
jgi:hypothetical protein